MISGASGASGRSAIRSCCGPRCARDRSLMAKVPLRMITVLMVGKASRVPVSILIEKLPRKWWVMGWRRNSAGPSEARHVRSLVWSEFLFRKVVMPAQVTQEQCTGCGDCVEVCPVEGSVVLENEKAVVRPDECIECNACVDACSSNAMRMAT